MELKIKIGEGVVDSPRYMTEGSAGLDLIANETVVIKPFQTVMVGTGLYMAIPATHYGMITSRSGLAKDGIVVANAPAVIDSDYRGEIRVLLYNRNKDAVTVLKKGERIAQMVLSPVDQAIIEVVEDLGETDRGDGGFGSTGI